MIIRKVKMFVVSRAWNEVKNFSPQRKTPVRLDWIGSAIWKVSYVAINKYINLPFLSLHVKEDMNRRISQTVIYFDRLGLGTMTSR